MAKSNNTDATIAASNKALSNSVNVKRQLRDKYAKEEKVPVYLAPMYQPYFGKNMRVMIQGVSVYVPVDGSTHMLPKTFASEVARRRMCIDNILTKQHRMSDVSANGEKAPGELALF